MNAPANLNVPRQPNGHVMIGMTCFDQKPDNRVIEAIDIAHLNLFNKHGWYTTFIKAFGCSDLCDSRNRLAAQFYGTPNYTKLLMIDADVIPDPGVLERLVQHPVDFVLGAYPKRGEGMGYPMKALPGPMECVDPLTGAPDPKNGLIKMAGGGAGMMCISRACIERMVEAYADRWYTHAAQATKKAWNLFEFTIVGHSLRPALARHRRRSVVRPALAATPHRREALFRRVPGALERNWSRGRSYQGDQDCLGPTFHHRRPHSLNCWGQSPLI